MLRDAFSERYTTVAGIAAGLVEFAESRGLDIRPECSRLGIDYTLFSSVTEHLSLGKVCALLEYCAEASGDEALGIHFGLQYTTGSTGALGYGLMAAPTLEDFLRFQTEHVPYATQTSYSKLTYGAETVSFSWTYAPVILKRDQFVDLGLTLIMRHMRTLFGPQTAAISVALERCQPLDQKPFHEAFGARIEFGARINRLLVPRRLLSLTNKRGDPRLYQLMDLQCRLLRPKLSEASDFREEIECFILTRMPDDEISLASAANHFGVSERTLQRRLAELDTTLNEMRDQLRQKLAGQLMAESGLSATEVSYRLGYSAPSAFSRSFHRWYGTSPRLYRSRSRAAKAGR